VTRYALLIFVWLILSSCASKHSGPPQAGGSRSLSTQSFEYPTVAAARSALRARTDLVIHEENGWLGFQDTATMTIWTFTPRNHPAYPSVVKQTVVPSANASVLRVSGLCEATKVECDKLMAEYAANVERIRQSVHVERQRFEFATVGDALAELRSNPRLISFRENGWLVYQDRANMVMWRFTPPDHPAHPSAVRTAMVRGENGFTVQWSSLCESTKPDCDKLVAEYKEQAERLRDQLRQKLEVAPGRL